MKTDFIHDEDVITQTMEDIVNQTYNHQPIHVPKSVCMAIYIFRLSLTFILGVEHADRYV